MLEVIFYVGNDRRSVIVAVRLQSREISEEIVGIADWIEFGQVSAERDDNLSQYFYENGVLEAAIRNRHQFLILGRKGAGKTAVFKHFSTEKIRYIRKDDFAESLSLQDYNWNVHNLLSSEGKAPSLAYIQSWKYVIYLACVNNLLKAGIKSKKLNAAGALISRVYSSPYPGFAQIIGQKLLQISRMKLPTGTLDLEGASLDAVSMEGGELSFEQVNEDVTLKASLNRNLERLTDIFEGALLDSLNGSRRIFITFDRIDEAWDSASFESSQKVIAGLIGAAETINGKFKGAIRPIIFLREDIFDTLDMNDKNKLRSDCGQLLAWTKEGLSRMILERVNYFAREADEPEFQKVDDLFDRDIMRQQRAPFDYIMLRTMLRPRDFIKSFQLVKNDMLDRQNNPYDEGEVDQKKLQCQSIYNSEPAYSEWLVEELRDEWRVQYPVINSLFSALQNNGITTFDSKDLHNSLSALNVKASPSEVAYYLKFLYDNSIIGFRVGNSQQWRFKCFFKSQGFVESALYKVHDGLHRGLNLKESRQKA